MSTTVRILYFRNAKEGEMQKQEKCPEQGERLTLEQCIIGSAFGE